MKKAFPLLLLSALLIGACLWASTTYATANRGALLFGEFFKPEPIGGYLAQRSLATYQNLEASLLRQAINHHQDGEYDLALVSLRAYLAGEAQPGEAEVLLLAVTAALATGNFAEAGAYLEQITPDDGQAFADARWYEALLDLRNEDASTLAGELPAATLQRYPVAELRQRI